MSVNFSWFLLLSVFPSSYVTLWRKWRERGRSHLLQLVVINVKEDNDDMETDHSSTQETQLQSIFFLLCCFIFPFPFFTLQKLQWGRFGLDLAWITTAQILLVLLKPQNVPVVSLSSQWIFNNLLSSPHCFLVCAAIWQCWQQRVGRKT